MLLCRKLVALFSLDLLPTKHNTSDILFDFMFERWVIQKRHEKIDFFFLGFAFSPQKTPNTHENPKMTAYFSNDFLDFVKDAKTVAKDTLYSITIGDVVMNVVIFALVFALIAFFYSKNGSVLSWKQYEYIAYASFCVVFAKGKPSHSFNRPVLSKSVLYCHR